jgi:CRP-like cAMP-binding protein
LPHLEPVPLPPRAVLHEPGEPIAHVHFPCSGVLSVLHPSDGRGVGIEVGVIGCEGVAGLAVFLGVERTPARCLVQVPGEALRMRARDFRTRVGRDTALHGLLLRYTHAFLAQVSQAAACISLHPVEKRLAGWLLMVQRRAGSDTFPLTHEFLAALLGVRRASVTEAAQGLQGGGLIRYRKGRLTVADRRGLESVACDCHRVSQAAMDRVPG